jgi:hypothetical protein
MGPPEEIEGGMVVPIADDDDAACAPRVRACSAITAIRAMNFLFNSGLHSMDGGMSIVSALQEKGSAIICSEILLTCFLYLSLLPLQGRTLDLPSTAGCCTLLADPTAGHKQ